MATKDVFLARKGRIRLQAAAALFGVALSGTLMFILERIMHHDLRLIALVLVSSGLIGFGYLLMLQVGRLFSNPPVIRADEEGLHFYGSAFNHGTVSWDNVREYGLVAHGVRKVALVYLHEPQEFLKGKSGLRGRLLRGNMKRYKTPVALPAGLFADDVQGVFERLANWSKA